MIVYYAGTLLKREWVIQDAHGQPYSIEGLTAEVIIKRTFDDPEQLLLIEFGDFLSFVEYPEIGINTLNLTLPELLIGPGNYVFYCVVLNPNRQVIECTHLTVLANHTAPEEVTP